MGKEFFKTQVCLLLVLVISTQIELSKTEETTTLLDGLVTETIKTRKLEKSDESEESTEDITLTPEIKKKHLNDTQKDFDKFANEYGVVYNISRRVEKLMATTLTTRIWSIINNNAELNALKETMGEIFPAVWKVPKRRGCKSQLDEKLAKEFSELEGLYQKLAHDLVKYMIAEHMEMTSIDDILGKMNSSFEWIRSYCKVWSESCESGPGSNDSECKRLARGCMKTLPQQEHFKNKIEEVKGRYGNVEKDFQSHIQKTVESKLKESLIPSVKACLNE